MKKVLLCTVAAVVGIVSVVRGVSQFRSPFDFVRLCKLACASQMYSVRRKNRCCGKEQCSCPRPQGAGASKTVSAYGSPTIYVNVGGDKQQQPYLLPGQMVGDYPDGYSAYGGGPPHVASSYSFGRDSRSALRQGGTIYGNPGVIGYDMQQAAPEYYRAGGGGAVQPGGWGGLGHAGGGYGGGGYGGCNECGSSSCSGGCTATNLCCWNVGPIGVGYCRFASESHSCFEHGDATTFGNLFGAVATDSTSLATLWFGKEDFTVEDIFADSFLDAKVLEEEFNPWLVFSKISPRFEFLEKGFFLGLHFQYRSGCLRLGAFIGAPYKDIRIKITSFIEEDLSSAVVDPTLDNALANCAIVPDLCDPTDDNSDFAYRLDFLSAIMCYGGAPIPGTPTLVLRDAGDITIGKPVNTAPVFITKSEDESPPTPVQIEGVDPGFIALGKSQTQVAGILPSDGAGTDGATYHFAPGTGTDYNSNLAMDRDAQRTLWMVPCYKNDGTGKPVYCNNDTRLVKEEIRKALESAVQKETGSEFLCRVAGINLQEDEKVDGFGDIMSRFYAGYCSSCLSICLFVDLTAPSGKKQEETRRVYFVAPGNNGHVATKLGIEAAFTVYNVLTFSFDVACESTFAATEQKSAPYQGATLRNISNQVDANVAWNSFITHADVSLNIGCFGVSGGYEGFAKGNDSADFSTGDTSTDFFDREKPLDARLIEECTNTVTHKVRGDFFYSSGTGKFFTGASFIPAGRNAMRETEIFLGFAATF